MAINNQREKNPTIEGGWPFTNYAQEDFNFNAGTGQRTNVLSIPRFKFTYLVEFQINERAFANPVTNLRQFVNNGKLYVHLRNIDHPKPNITVEKLRSYNKWITVPTKTEYPAANLSFHDDTTAVVQALWKEHTNFYSHAATIGQDITAGTTSNIRGNDKRSYQFDDSRLTATDGSEMRSHMGDRPSLGMKLKANDMRHFFDAIVIYDLGTEPDGINVYWYHNPMFTIWDHENLDKEDRTGNVGINVTFEYEGYYWTFGQNRGRILDVIQDRLGFAPLEAADLERKEGIAREQTPSRVDTRVSDAGANSLSTFPTEDSLIRRQAQQTGSGQDGTTDGANLSQEERDNGVRIYPQPGFNDPLPEPTPLADPLADDRPVVPNSLVEKQEDLRQVRRERNQLFRDAEESGEPLDSDRVAALNEREQVLSDEITTQQRQVQERAGRPTAEERSAFENTQAASGAMSTPVSGTVPTAVDDAANTAFARVENQRIQNEEDRDANFRQQRAILDQNGGDQSDPRLEKLRGEQLALQAADRELRKQQNAILFDPNFDPTNP